MTYEHKREEAERRLEEILSTGRLKGVDLRLSRGHQVDWAPPRRASYFGIPEGTGKHAVAPATVDTRAFLRMQSKTRSGTFGSFLLGAYDKTVNRARESAKRGTGDIPTPVLEIRYDGKVVQEGRSRAKGAMEGGADRMPVWIAVEAYK